METVLDHWSGFGVFTQVLKAEAFSELWAEGDMTGETGSYRVTLLDLKMEEGVEGRNVRQPLGAGEWHPLGDLQKGMQTCYP